MIVNNQKFACTSCIRGHRVSACNHADRDLFPIAKKGRPVKQCEHCRSARKDKSHHAKCDCGSKKNKDATTVKAEANNEAGCCCRTGTKCTCGVKNEDVEVRFQASLNRQTQPVKSKPAFTSTNSDPVFTHGHPKHPKHNTLAHTAYLPYTKSKSGRPHSIHSTTYPSEGHDYTDSSRSMDDMRLNDGGRFYGMGMGYAAQSEDNLLTSPFDSTFPDIYQSYSPELPESMGDDGSALTRTPSGEALSTSMSWYDPSLPTVTEALNDYSASPNGIFEFGDGDWNLPIPSATGTDFFSPSDLPLVTSQPSDFSQPISHSGESNYQSAPALTASSSGTLSEDEPAFPAESEADKVTSHWSGTVQFRDTAPVSQDFPFPQSLPSFNGSIKRKPNRPRHRQTYSAGSNHMSHASGSTDSIVHASDRGVNIGHLQNLESLKRAREAAAFSSAQSSPSYPPMNESELRSITIPASIEDGSINDDWYFPISELPPPSMTTTDFAWLA